MLNRKFLSLSLILGFMFVSVSVFATNLTERNVYGILSENFTGAVYTNGQSQDNIRHWVGSSYGDWKAVAAVEISSAPANAKEGKKYWEFLMEKWSSVDTDFPTNYSAAIAFYFVGSDNSTARPKDLSHFKYLDFWVKPKTGDITKVFVGMTDSADRCVSLGSLGVTNSNTWQHVVLNITTLPNINLANIKNCLIMKAENNTLSGNTAFFVDNVVLRTDSASASFNATLKKVEAMQNVPANPTQITWKDSVFISRDWQSCGQYVELDMDMYSWKWTVRVYTNNGGEGRGGMYATLGGKDYIIPMCWRAYSGELGIEPGKDSYIIKQSTASHHNLYDGLKSNGVDEGYYTWFYMKDQADIDFNNPSDTDYITVWDSSLGGYHGEVNSVGNGYYDFVGKVEKKPKIYFGGGFANSAGGITYVGNVVIELNYE